MRVLLVDDEIFTIRMLQSVICWREMGLELVGYAQDGESAYEKVVKEKPDIIISDIRMPGMDGLEFLRKVNSYDPAIKLILMSAYADFSYVKEGLRLGCSDYILKPVDEAELEQALWKVIRAIQGEKEQEQVISKSVKQLERMNLYQYMRTGHRKNKVIKMSSEPRWQLFSVFLVQIDSTTIDEYTGLENIRMGHEGYLTSVLEQAVAHWGAECTVFDYEEDCWVMVLGGIPGAGESAGQLKREDAAQGANTGQLSRRETAQESITQFSRERAAREIIDCMLRETGMQVKVCFSLFGRSFDELPELYEEVQDLSKYSFYVGDESVLGYGYNCRKEELEEVREIGILREKMRSGREIPLRDDDSVRGGDRAHAEGGSRDSVRDGGWAHAEGGSRDIARDGDSNSTRNGSGDSVRGGDRAHARDGSGDSTRDGGREAEVIISETSSRLVTECIHLIEKRYSENLSLEEICQKISVSKNYFCYLFKREMGVSIWNYLTNVRLQHAKKLLEETELRSYEIAFQVGYDNPSYFSKIFKKYENMTPNEYRESRK